MQIQNTSEYDGGDSRRVDGEPYGFSSALHAPASAAESHSMFEQRADGGEVVHHHEPMSLEREPSLW